MKKSERKIIYRWSASIFLVVIIPVVFGCILYAYSLKNIRQKAEETNERVILEKENQLTWICKECDELSSRIMADSNVNAVLKGASIRADGTDVYLQAQKLLQEKQRENPMLKGIYLYFPWSGTVLGDSYCFDIMGNEEYVRRKLSMGRDAFFQLLSGSIMNTVHLAGEGGEPGEKQQIIFTSVLRDNVYFMNQRVIVLFYLDTAYFDREFYSDGMNLYIQDEAGAVYHVLSEEEQIGMAEIGQIEFPEGTFWWKGESCISGTELPAYGLKLYTVQQEVRYRRELQNMMWLLGGYIVLCAVLGGLLSYLISRWNYKPIGELADMLSRHKKDVDGAGSGWEAMQEGVRQLMKGYEQERERSRSMDEVIQDVRISRILVKGELLSAVEAEACQEREKEAKKRDVGGAYGEGKGKYRGTDGMYSDADKDANRNANKDTRINGKFVVVSFDAEEILSEGQTEGAWSKEQDRKLIYFIIENVATELLGESCYHRSGSIEDLYYFILWRPEENQDCDDLEEAGASDNGLNSDAANHLEHRGDVFLEEVRRQMLQLCRFFEESYQLRVCVNLSRLAVREEELHQCYQDVLCLTQYRSQVGSEEALLLYSERNQNPSLERFERYWMTCEQVNDLLREQQMEEAARQLLKWLPENGLAESRPAKMVALEEVQSQNTVPERLTAENADPELEQEQEAARSRSQKKGQDSGRGQEKEKRKSQETTQRIEQVLAYIEEHYCDAQITVGSIAERFGIHISTLSRDMKTKKGVGVLEYIGSLRLNRAKELLAQGMSVNDTAKEVGFYSSRPLVRLFQEREGVTPAQYGRTMGKAKK